MAFVNPESKEVEKRISNNDNGRNATPDNDNVLFG